MYDDTPLLAGYLLDLGTYAAGYARQRTTAAYLRTVPGTDLSDQGSLLGRDGTGSVSRVLKRYQNLGVSTVGDYVANLREEAAFRSTLLQGLVWFVTLIALLGVANTQALSVVERTREIGLLRAIGMRPRQVARMLRAETLRGRAARHDPRPARRDGRCLAGGGARCPGLPSAGMVTSGQRPARHRARRGRRLRPGRPRDRTPRHPHQRAARDRHRVGLVTGPMIGS